MSVRKTRIKVQGKMYYPQVRIWHVWWALQIPVVDSAFTVTSTPSMDVAEMIIEQYLHKIALDKKDKAESHYIYPHGE